jgi:hypothetical protein
MTTLRGHPMRLLALAAFIVSLLIGGCASPQPAASPAAGPAIQRAHFIQCPSHSLGASIELAADGSHYDGIARDNFQNTKYPLCSFSPQEIRCEGEWSITHDSATLVIRPEPDGKFYAHLARAGGKEATFECVTTEQDLGPGCVFNPGTPACQQPQDNQK